MESKGRCKSGVCAEVGSVPASIFVHALPQIFNVTGGGTYCQGGAGVPVGLSNSQSGFVYNLLVNGTYLGSLWGTGGPISFGNQTIAGTYTIQGYNTPLSYACNLPMNGSVAVAVSPGTVGGTVNAAANEVCASTSNFPANFFTLSGYTGTIVQWEWSINGSTWNAWIGGGVGSPVGYINYGATFYVRALVQSGGCPAAYSSVKTVTVHSNTVGGTVSPVNQNICIGQNTVPVWNTLSGQVGSVVRWEFATPGGGWNNWNGGGSTTAPNNCCFNTVGVWRIRAIVKSGTCAEVASGEATITVNPLPVAAINGPATTCNGTAVTLTATGGGTYLWSAGSQTTAAISVNPTTTTTYTVTVTSALGCTATAQQTVTVNSQPTASISGNQTICAGGSSVFTATGGGTYVWSAGAQTTAAITVTTAGTYTVTVTLPGGCTATASRTLTVNPLPTASISGNQTICAGGSSVFTATGGTSYLWNTNATTAAITVSTAGTYTVTVTDANGCSATATRALTVNPLPVASISGPATTCNGMAVTLTATGGGTYLWSAGSQTTVSISVNPATTTTYTVTVTSALGCTATEQQTVTVNSQPVASISGTQVVCAAEVVYSQRQAVIHTCGV